MTTRTESNGSASPTVEGGALRRFRAAAITTGIGLLGLVAVMIVRYGFGNATPSAVWSPIHGVIYMVYMALTIDLAIKARWSIVGTLLVLLAGCVPIVSFVAEHRVTKRVRAGLRI
ncbi:DUF3817 domain-containing protein [Haloechinothrix sp. YIM 98757]|uniref:DUF3817 domain-containing protein n=1 Tax=Haloechinothrix aidingensis TaxID=2752311 RepID=A0A838A777_9PSEU|nr:DUF3817 domain-containing protein [Haloechinothrix aidingensis]MBA0124915.1 DUF3817 domain-containing protein [Haloechinothrix aidingensis]